MLRKLDGRWALVSKSTGRPLAYWRGEGKPPKSWVDQEERRIQYFKRNPIDDLDIGDRVLDTRDNRVGIVDGFPDEDEQPDWGKGLEDYVRVKFHGETRYTYVRSRYLRKVFAKENPLPETAIYWIVGGLAAVGAIGAAYFMSSTASGSTGSTGSPGATGNGTITLPPQTITRTATPGGSTSTQKMNFAATEANNGSTYTMKVGDTLTVTLDVPSGAATFADAQVTGSGLSAGSAASLSGQTLQVFTAASAGTETISYQPVDSNSQPVGSMYSFTAVIT